MKVWKLKSHLIAEELFQFSLITYLILLLIETVQEGFVSYFFNLHILLGIIILNALIIVMTYDEKLKTSQKITKLNKTFVTLLIIGGSLLVYHKANILDSSALIIALVTGVFLFCLSVLPHNE